MGHSTYTPRESFPQQLYVFNHQNEPLPLWTIPVNWESMKSKEASGRSRGRSKRIGGDHGELIARNQERSSSQCPHGITTTLCRPEQIRRARSDGGSTVDGLTGNLRVFVTENPTIRH